MPIDEDFSLQSERLTRALSLLSRHVTGERRVIPEQPPFNIPWELPVQGVGGAVTLQQLADGFFPAAARLGQPGYFAHMDPPAPWVPGVGALRAASCNQNLIHTDQDEAHVTWESKVVAWLCKPFGMNGGHLVPGSTLANNTTPFLVFLKTPERAPAGDGPCMTSFVFHVRNILAALYKALDGFATNGINMTKLESHLEGGAFSAAMFFAEVEVHPDENGLKLALEELEFFSSSVKILGIYPADPFRTMAPA